MVLTLPLVKNRVTIKIRLNFQHVVLGSARVGCTVGNMVVNNLMFADNICGFSPTIKLRLQHLDICGDYAAEHKITFNCNKTWCSFLPQI